VKTYCEFCSLEKDYQTFEDMDGHSRHICSTCGQDVKVGMRKPIESYIKRNVETQSMQVRVSAKLKFDAELTAKAMNTSLNRLVEAALEYYLEQLKVY
jgi:predicted HicB family RNase H-like nuclease